MTKTGVTTRSGATKALAETPEAHPPSPITTVFSDLLYGVERALQLERSSELPLTPNKADARIAAHAAWLETVNTCSECYFMDGEAEETAALKHCALLFQLIIETPSPSDAIQLQASMLEHAELFEVRSAELQKLMARATNQIAEIVTLKRARSKSTFRLN